GGGGGGMGGKCGAAGRRGAADGDGGEALNGPSPFGATSAIFSVGFAATMRRADTSRRDHHGTRNGRTGQSAASRPACAADAAAGRDRRPRAGGGACALSPRP